MREEQLPRPVLKNTVHVPVLRHDKDLAQELPLSLVLEHYG